MLKDSAPASCKLALWQVIECLWMNAILFCLFCPTGLGFKLSLVDKEKKLSSRSSTCWEDCLGVCWVWQDFLLSLLPCILPPSPHSPFSRHWSSLHVSWSPFLQDLCTCCLSPMSACFLFFLPDYSWLLSQDLHFHITQGASPDVQAGGKWLR